MPHYSGAQQFFFVDFEQVHATVGHPSYVTSPLCLMQCQNLGPVTLHHSTAAPPPAWALPCQLQLTACSHAMVCVSSHQMAGHVTHQVAPCINNTMLGGRSRQSSVSRRGLICRQQHPIHQAPQPHPQHPINQAPHPQHPINQAPHSQHPINQALHPQHPVHQAPQLHPQLHHNNHSPQQQQSQNHQHLRSHAQQHHHQALHPQTPHHYSNLALQQSQNSQRVQGSEQSNRTVQHPAPQPNATTRRVVHHIAAPPTYAHHAMPVYQRYDEVVLENQLHHLHGTPLLSSDLHGSPLLSSDQHGTALMSSSRPVVSNQSTTQERPGLIQYIPTTSALGHQWASIRPPAPPGYLLHFVTVLSRPLAGSLPRATAGRHDDIADGNSYEAFLSIAERLGDVKSRGMTQYEVQQLPSYYYSIDDHTSTLDQHTCVVCMADFINRQLLRVLPCNHEFHAKCIDRWLKANRTCPICRADTLATKPSSVQETHDTESA